MDSFIALPEAERRTYCEQAQAKLGLPPSGIEKDFWVCWVLRELIRLPDWGPRFSFKGGTSLSKGWKLIDRFSEDLDIVIDREFLGFGGEMSPEAATGAKGIKRRLKELKATCQVRIHEDLKPRLDGRFRTALPTGTAWSLMPDESDPDRQTLLFGYPGVFTSSATYLRPVVKIEMGARSDTEPSEQPVIQTYLAEAFPKLLKESSFVARTVAQERTFWEKAMLLHEETYRPRDKHRNARLARHYYDLWCLISKGVGDRALKAEGLFKRVAKHRALFFHQNWMDYATLRPESLRLVPLEDQLTEWRTDYNAMRGEMFFGEPPPFAEILRVVGEFQERVRHSGMWRP